VFFTLIARPCLELVKRPTGLGHTDDRHVQVPTCDQRLQRRNIFVVS